MNTNQKLAAIGLVLFATVSGVAAFGLRYTPITTNGVEIHVVWDRWERQACQVSLEPAFPVACSQTVRHR